MIHFVDINNIVVPDDRQRKEFEENAMVALSESVEEHGLISPIVLGSHAVLIAGERRLRVVKDIYALGGTLFFMGSPCPSNTIPCILFEELDEIAQMEIEYDENCKRENLTWQEKAAATAKLQQIRAAQAVRRGEEAPTLKALAEEISGSSSGHPADQVSKELIVSRHLDDPEVAGAKTVKEAFQVLKRKEAEKKHKELADSVGKVYSSSVHTALNADSLEWMQRCADEQFDVILTDPPYGMGADEFGDSGGRSDLGHAYVDDYETWKEICMYLAKEGYRITKPQAHLYMFLDIENFEEAKRHFTGNGWTVFRTPLIWHKPNAMRAPWPEHGPQRKYEVLLYAMKGKKPVTKIYPDVMTHQPDSNEGHAAQKPVALFKDLLLRSVQPGDKVLDPFMGSGTIFPAAHDLKVIATGIELNENSYGIAVKRLKDLK